MLLRDKVAIVTGGGQGIGEGIARCLSAEGATVMVVDINKTNARQVAADINTAGGKGYGIEADLSDTAQVVEMVRTTLEYAGKIDILVNNAGGHSAAPPRQQPALFTDRGDIEWQGYYEQNLKSTVAVTREIVPYFKAQQHGKIVNISSDAARRGDPMLTPYSVFKAGVISLTFCLAKELAADNINVNCICPGWIYSPLVEQPAIRTFNSIKELLARGEPVPPRYKDRLPEGFNIDAYTPHSLWQKLVIEPVVPLKREQTAEDIGNTVVFFVSEKARNITGQCISVDGGMIIQ